ncbi:MAG: imidazole glycerol phosphate synthase subunit HisH [Sulfurimonas sp.]|jgi:glutamine amidotransferase|nr:imidazole glycerol phosphate synthase subunit HisH [Sulfurimonadaceae bacterium]
MVAIVDYGVGNLASIKNAFSILGQKVVLESDATKLKNYDKLLLPGVGAFGDAMAHLQDKDMIEPLKEFAKSGNYMLGICLGMQLLFESSEEFGSHDGLGLISGKVVHFDTTRFEQKLKVPHIGWNRIFTKKHRLFDGLDDKHYLYFVHSYHVLCKDERDVIAKSIYGYEFSSAVAHNNILGIQPHPEKSHQNGLKILENFINL